MFFHGTLQAGELIGKILSGSQCPLLLVFGDRSLWSLSN
jgi:hypothetical protein